MFFLFTKKSMFLLFLNIIVINCNAEDLEYMPLKGHNAPIKSIILSNDDTSIASIAPQESSIHIWYRNHLEYFKEDQCVVLQDKASSGAFNNNGTLFASAGYDGVVRIYYKNESGLFNPEKTTPLNGHTKRALSVDFSHNNRMLASTSKDGTIRIWYKNSDTDSFNPENCTILSHPTKKFTLFFYPHPSAFFDSNNKTVMVIGFDKNIYLWHANETGRFNEKDYTILSGHKDYVTSACFSRDGKTIISGSKDKTIKVWSQNQEGLFDNTCITLTGHTSWINHVVLSHNNNAIISTSFDRTMRLWEKTNTGAYTSKQSTLLAKNIQNLGKPSFNSDDNMIINNIFNIYLAIWIKDPQGVFNGKKICGRKMPIELTHNITTTTFFHTLKNLAVSNGTDNNVYLWKITLPQSINHLLLQEKDSEKECCICFEKASDEKKLQYLPCYLTETEKDLQRKYYNEEIKKYKKLKDTPTKEAKLKEEELDEKKRILELGVRHTEPICSTCLKDLTTTKATCPLCRNPLFEGQD